MSFEPKTVVNTKHLTFEERDRHVWGALIKVLLVMTKAGKPFVRGTWNDFFNAVFPSLVREDKDSKALYIPAVSIGVESLLELGIVKEERVKGKKYKLVTVIDRQKLIDALKRVTQSYDASLIEDIKAYFDIINKPLDDSKFDTATDNMRDFLFGGVPVKQETLTPPQEPVKTTEPLTDDSDIPF